MKTITIAVPTHNRKNTLSENLLRLIELKKEIPSLVILVSDNASTDGTKEFLDTISPKEEIRYLRSEVNLGIAGNQLVIFHATDTDYLWIISDDDLLDLSHAKQLLDIIQQDDYCLVAMNYSSFSSNDRYTQKIIGPRASMEYVRALDLLNQPSVGHFSAFVYNVSDIKSVLYDGLRFIDIDYHNKARGLYLDVAIRVCATSPKKSFYYGQTCIQARIPLQIDYDTLGHMCVDYLKYFRLYETYQLVSIDDFLYRKSLVRSLLARAILADSFRYNSSKLYLFKKYLLAEFKNDKLLVLLINVFINPIGSKISKFIYRMYRLVNTNAIKKEDSIPEKY